jgi:hypothetical protein
MATHFLLEVGRETIVEDCLQKIIHMSKKAGQADPLKLPIILRFKDEPGIDEGGVRKEFFQLIMAELFSSTYGMFKHNEDTQLYWFNGKSMEPPIYFELVGSLMGIALHNGLNINVPLAPVVFKLLFGERPDMSDMLIWQPELANSLQFILDYEDHAKKPLEDIVCRTFSVDVESFGSIESIDLIPNGSEIVVNKENREHFVRQYIEYEFQRQCAVQFASFKKGFERLADTSFLKDVLNADELEQTICGERKLNFAELKDGARYCNGYTRECKEMTWFWDIVLNEWDEAKRRKLLTFSTGSDRAPVSGLKHMKFYIIKDGDEEEKLPTSHTCFN